MSEFCLSNSPSWMISEREVLINMITNKRELYDYLNADKRSLGRTARRPGFTDLIWKYEIHLRKCEYYHNCSQNILRKFLLFYHKYMRFRLGVKCGFIIPLNVCGKGLSLPHTGSIVINENAPIGEYCRIHVGVNIGAQAGDSKKAPHIGNYVYIAPGAKLFNDIKIGDWNAIGANAVVNKSFTQSGVTIAGIPAKVINNRGSRGIVYSGDK